MVGGLPIARQKEDYPENLLILGPVNAPARTLVHLADLFVSFWGNAAWEHVPSARKKKEALLLQLSAHKTQKKLSWRSALSFKETVEFTASWYKQYYGKKIRYDGF